MKWIILIANVVLMVGCTRDVVEYREVLTPVVSPVPFYSSPRPLDVTATTIDYY